MLGDVLSDLLPGNLRRLHRSLLLLPSMEDAHLENLLLAGARWVRDKSLGGRLLGESVDCLAEELQLFIISVL